MENNSLFILKAKMENNINKRNLAIQLFSLVIAGTIGLFYIDISLKTIILFCLGLYYIVILINNYINFDKKLKKYYSTWSKFNDRNSSFNFCRTCWCLWY